MMMMEWLGVCGRWFLSTSLFRGAGLPRRQQAVREAMCFLMDPQIGKKLCCVQFPQRFDGIDRHDRYANHNVVFFDINMKGLDGIQGPVYVGTGCVFNRQALYGYDPPASEKQPKITCDCWLSWCCCCCGGPRKPKDKKKGLRSLLGIRVPTPYLGLGRSSPPSLGLRRRPWVFAAAASSINSCRPSKEWERERMILEEGFK